MESDYRAQRTVTTRKVPPTPQKRSEYPSHHPDLKGRPSVQSLKLQIESLKTNPQQVTRDASQISSAVPSIRRRRLLLNTAAAGNLAANDVKLNQALTKMTARDRDPSYAATGSERLRYVPELRFSNRPERKFQPNIRPDL